MQKRARTFKINTIWGDFILLVLSLNRRLDLRVVITFLKLYFINVWAHFIRLLTLEDIQIVCKEHHLPFYAQFPLWLCFFSHSPLLPTLTSKVSLTTTETPGLLWAAAATTPPTVSSTTALCAPRQVTEPTLVRAGRSYKHFLRWSFWLNSDSALFRFHLFHSWYMSWLFVFK